MLWDTHMHTLFSGDCQAALPDMILAAEKQGLDGICFTDHLDIDFPGEPETFLLDLPNYMAAVHAAQEQYRERISIRFGIELGLQPHLAKINADILSQYPFDFVIGSSHTVSRMDPYYPPYWEAHTEHECFLLYFESVLENIHAFDGFDVYGHIDYVVRYSPHKNKNYSYRKYADILDEILKLLISKGKGIEINTGGFRQGLGRPNPAEDVLARYRELGGEILTVGADAHKPDQVASCFHEIPRILKEAGFRYYTVFTDRKPEFIKLPE